jgi:hypothetical protein
MVYSTSQEINTIEAYKSRIVNPVLATVQHLTHSETSTERLQNDNNTPRRKILWTHDPLLDFTRPFAPTCQSSCSCSKDGHV